jgi:hypothetical protein
MPRNAANLIGMLGQHSRDSQLTLPQNPFELKNRAIIFYSSIHDDGG